MNLGATEWGSVDWISLAQDRAHWSALVNAVMDLPVSQCAVLQKGSAPWSYWSVLTPTVSAGLQRSGRGADWKCELCKAGRAVATARSSRRAVLWR
jgi:hypothetical protein